jgi:starch-binding outer membrane protein SusE/F
MKIILKYLTVVVSLMVILASCKKDENVIYYEGGTNPVLTASRTGTLPLSFATSSQQLLKLTWTNPEYKFTTGISSQDVTYMIEIDTTGANFTNPSRGKISIAKDLEKTFTVGEINDILLNQLQLDSLQTHNIEIRVTASIGGAAPLSSNVIKYTSVKPYSIPPKVQPPAAGNLWTVGDAFSSGWTNPLLAPHVSTQKFTKISNTLYELTVAMPGGGNYKLLQDNGVWGTQYHMLPGGTWEGGDFEMKDSDPGFPGPPTAGTYKITVDFQRGKYTVIKL